MDAFFDNFLNYKGFGPAASCCNVPDEAFEYYRGKLPDKLLDYWRAYGWCAYGKGIFWTVDPAEWEDVLEAWIGDTSFMEQDAYHVFARSAFGDLYLWGERSGPSLRIHPAWGMIYPSFHPDEFLEDGPDFSLQLFFSGCSKEFMDLRDEDQNPLFDRALEKLGPLDDQSVYGFVPALVAGGRADLAGVQKLDAHVHLEILAQLGPRRIMNQA